MKNLVLLIIAALVTSGATYSTAFTQSINSPKQSTYGMHLFFNETEFIDVFTLKQDAEGQFTGHMDVPNDFEGPLLNINLEGDILTFDLFVPKNASRPKDLIFHYEGRFHDQSQNQLIGFVTVKGQKEFVASFVAFRR